MASCPQHPSAWHLSIAVALIAMAACGVEQEAHEPLVRPVRTQQVQSTGSEQVRSFTGSTATAVRRVRTTMTMWTLMTGTQKTILQQIHSREVQHQKVKL